MRTPRLLLAVALLAATSLAGIGLMGVSAWLLDRAAQHPEASALTVAAVAVRALGIGRGLLRYAERLVGHDAVLRDAAARRAALFARLRRGPRPASGAAVSALVHDVEAAQDVQLRGTLPLAASALVVLVVVPLMTALLPAAGLVLAVGLAGAAVVVPVVSWRAAGAEDGRAAARAEHLTAVADVLHGAGDLVALHGLAGATATAGTTAAELLRLDLRAARRQAALAALGPLLQGGTAFALLVLAASAVRHGALPPVDAAVVVLVGWASFEPAATSHEAAAALRRGRSALRRWRRLGSETPAGPAPAYGGPVVLTGATLQYPGRSRPAVAHVDLELRPGTTLGVVGGSGAGKSSLLALLAGAVAPTQGRAALGSAALHLLPEADRARSVVLAEQAAHVFDASVRDNLRLADPGASDDALLAALGTVGLSGWLATLPDGLGTRLGHRGARLSGGQRRRLTVARALLSPAPVLLLDEPTEGLAPDEADALLAEVLDAARGRAVVVVSHRPLAWAALDELLVLDDGRVVDRGTPLALAARPGLVAEAWAMTGGPDGRGPRSPAAGTCAPGLPLAPAGA